MNNGIILCSGGLDSVTTAFYVKKKLGFDKIIILFLNYGQRNLNAERKCSRKCAKNLSAEFKEIDLSELGKISTSMLNSSEKATKIKDDLKDTKKESGKWYVPFRNTIFLAYALAYAESFYVKRGEIYELFVGFKSEGKEAYPDTTPEFVEVMNKMQEVAGGGKFKINAPLIKMDKEDIVNLGNKLGINFKETFSCYVSPDEKHCGTCLSCRLRQAGFYWADVEDVTEYKSE